MFLKDFLSYERTVICPLSKVASIHAGQLLWYSDFCYAKHMDPVQFCLFSNFDGNKYDLFKLYKKKSIAFLYKYL